MKFVFIFIPYQKILPLVFLMLLIIPHTALGNSNIKERSIENIPYQDISSGTLYFKNEQGYFTALTQSSDYQVSVNGLLARVTFTQTFKNSSDSFLEAVYVFPLINDAAVDSMIMEIGERRIIGKIKEKQQAKKLYQKAKIQGKKTSLVSQQRPNLFTTKLANIAPRETIKITLSYLQSVALNNETFSLRIPLTLTPRFIPTQKITELSESIRLTLKAHKITTVINSHGWAVNNAIVVDVSEITPFQRRVNYKENQGENLSQTVNLSVKLNTALPITHVLSLNHRINQSKEPSTITVALADKRVLLDQDFVLEWQITQGDVPKAALFTQEMNDDTDDFNYGLMMLMPPKQEHVQAIQKEVIYIIDTSGSMGGVAIRQAKKSLITALDLLNHGDRFNIIAFNNEISLVFSDSKLANKTNIGEAKHWLLTLDAGGGTNMYPAIERALKKSITGENYKQVIFITDGSVGNEDELLSLIEKNLHNTRLHTIGIGSAPNGYFMTQAAKVGRGTYRYIGSINEVSEKMTDLFSQISKPLMQNIKIIWPLDQVEIFPKQIPDLYDGQPLLISARWAKQNKQSKKKQDSRIKVSGELGDIPWQEELVINTDSNSKDKNSMIKNIVDNGVAQWWARQKIKHLTSLHRRSNKQDKEGIKSQIIQLALAHHLVSPYTSFIAIEENISRKANVSLKSKNIKNLMPKGSTQAIPMPNTALGIIGYLYFSLLMMIMAVVILFVGNTIQAIKSDEKTC